MIVLKSNFQEEFVYDEFNELISEFMGFMEEDGSIVETTPLRFDELENLIFNNLFEKTNLEGELNNLKVSHNSLNLIKAFKIMKVNNEFTYEKLFYYLSENLESLRRLNINKYKFIFPLNIKKSWLVEDLITEKEIEIEFKKDSAFKKTYELFNINKFDLDTEIISNPKIRKIVDILESYNGEILETEIEARDEDYGFKNAINNLETFFGFISMILYSGNIRTKFLYNEEDFRFSKIEVINVFVITNDDVDESHWLYIHFNERRILDNFRNFEMVDIKEKLVDNDALNMQYNRLKNISNNKLRNTYFNALSLYFLAVSEKSLYYSFLNYWVVSEFIIQSPSGKDSEQVLELMGDIFEFGLQDKFLRSRVRFLGKRRNNAIHRGITKIINQDDLNLSKLIADNLLLFYLYSIDYYNVNNLQEFDEVIRNIQDYAT